MSVNHTHICTTCDVVQEPGDGFCDDCGTQLVPIRYCDDCGVKALHPGKFCRECGAKLPKIEAVSPPASQTIISVAPVKPVKPAQPVSLNKSKPKPVPKPKLKPKPKPISTPRQVVKPVNVAPTNNNTPAPLAARPMAAPVAMRPAPLAPASGAANTTALVGGAVGALAMIGLMTGAMPLQLVLVFFTMMLILGGMRLRHTAANGIDGLIDWVWEDPVLRKRILGE